MIKDPFGKKTGVPTNNILLNIILHFLDGSKQDRYGIAAWFSVRVRF